MIEFDESAKQIPLVRMTPEQLDALRGSLAHKVGELERCESEKKATVESYNDTIKTLREEVSEIAAQIREQEGTG